MFEAIIKSEDKKQTSAKEIADIVKQGKNDKAEKEAFIEELTKPENMKKIQEKASSWIHELAKNIIENMNMKNKTATVKIDNTTYDFTAKECSKLLLAYWAICKNKAITSNLKEYANGTWKLLIDFEKWVQSFGIQINTLINEARKERQAEIKKNKTDESDLKKKVMKNLNIPTAQSEKFQKESTKTTSITLEKKQNAKIETVQNKFKTIDITDENGKKVSRIRYFASPEFDPSTGQCNIYYPGYGLDLHDTEKNIFKDGSLLWNQAYIIVEGNPAHISRANSPAKRYDNIFTSFSSFRSGMENQVFGGKKIQQPRLIGHSGAGITVDTIAWKLMAQGINPKCVIVDGTYQPLKNVAKLKERNKDQVKVYYVEGQPTQNNLTVRFEKEKKEVNLWGIAMTWGHYAVAPVLAKEGILSA